MTEFTGKTVIVTGGANGIGRGIVGRFAKAGANVVVADVDEDRGAKLAESLGRETARFIKTDVADTQQISDCISTVHETTGRIDCLINNAGIADTSTLENLAEEKAVMVFRVLMLSVMTATRHVVPIMRAQGGGVILNTTSVRGVVSSSRGGFAYSALKAAVIHWTKSVSSQLAVDGIRINCVSPGGVPTRLLVDTMFPDGAPAGDGSMIEQVKPMLAAAQPIQRAGEPADIAEAMFFLASSNAQWVTGQNLVVDGGYTSMSLEGTAS